MKFKGVLGHEMVGSVVSGQKEWLNKRVVCEINCVCRKCEMCLGGLATHCLRRTVMGIDGRDGCFADLVAVPAHNLHAVPDTLSDEDAVFVEPLAAAYQVLAQCQIDPRMKVSVVGTGRLGLLVVQALATTGCKLTAVGRNAAKLMMCEKKGVQGIHVDELVGGRDRDVVVECSGSPAGLGVALRLVRPRGTVVLKSTYALEGQAAAMPRVERSSAPPDLSQIVINEVNLLGSRCGPFPEAINALARQAVEVRSLISRTYPIERALEALSAAADPANIKVLLKINPR